MKQGRIVPLPHWVLTNYQSAFYDSESGTILQALARIYPKIEELITDYNDYVKQLDSYITDFTNGLISDFDSFKSCIIKTMDDYIESIDTKMSVQDTLIADKFREQDELIANAIKYMKDNIIATTNNIINQAIENGDLNVGFEYNPSDESLNFIVTREGD
jgi:hypothetical protein